MRENLLDVACHEKFVHEKIERDRVLDAVLNEGSAIAFLENMFVPPEAVGPAHLFVDETRRRLPDRDPALPANREPVDPQLMIDQRSRPHLDRRRRDGVKVHPWRSDGVEIGGIGEKRENFFARARQPKLGSKFANAHCWRPGQIFRES